MDPLGTDFCLETVPMELPVPNGSMHHREPKSKIDDTSMILQGASCTIAADLRTRIAVTLPIFGFIDPDFDHRLCRIARRVFLDHF